MDIVALENQLFILKAIAKTNTNFGEQVAPSAKMKLLSKSDALLKSLEYANNRLNRLREDDRQSQKIS